MSDPTRAALEELGHQPTGDGDMCLHRWRNRTTRAVHCPFLAGWRAALASREERPGLDELEWLVWFARKSHGTAAEVARRALEQNPYLALSSDTPEAET